MSKRDVRPLTQQGAWLSNVTRYVDYAKMYLEKHKFAAAETNRQWPLPLDETLRNPDDYPVLKSLVRERDSYLDAVLVFSAMAVEGFLNFYGVVRLGEARYTKDFERKGLSSKLKSLLFECDSISVNDNDPISAICIRISERRNNLLHPKSQELPGYVPAESRPSLPIPKAAEDAVADLDGFFAEFLSLVPDANHLIPKIYEKRAERGEPS